MTIQEILDLGNVSAGFCEALGRKLAIGTTLAGRTEDVVPAAAAGTLAFPALIVECVWNETAGAVVEVIPAGEVPAANQVAIAADRKTLAFNAAQNGQTITFRYLPLAVLPTATFAP